MIFASLGTEQNDDDYSHFPEFTFNKSCFTFFVNLKNIDYSEEHKENEILTDYYKFYHKGYDFLKKKNYKKAKSEFIKILKFRHPSGSYYTHLLRIYKAIIKDLISKKKINEAFSEFQEMFNNCPNITEKNYKEFQKFVKNNNLNIDSNEVLKKDEFKVEGNLIIIDSREFPKDISVKIKNSDIYKNYHKSIILPDQLPYITFSESIQFKNEIILNPNLDVKEFYYDYGSDNFIFPPLSHSFVEPKPSEKIEINISEKKYKTIKIDHLAFNSDKSFYCVTSKYALFILDNTSVIKKIFKTPNNDGFEKQKYSNIESSVGSDKVKEALALLELPKNPEIEQIKRAYRKKVFLYHPDKNKVPDSHKIFIELQNAYELLTKLPPETAFENIEEKEHWVQIMEKIKIEVNGLEFGFQIGMIGLSPYDYISSVFFKSEKRLFIGTNSGSIYELDLDHFKIIRKLFLKGEDKYTKFNILHMFFSDDTMLVETFEYILVFSGNNLLNKYLKDRDEEIKYFKNGFITINDNRNIKVFNRLSKKIGSISFYTPIKIVCVKDNMLYIETSKKFYLFRYENIE